MKINKIIDEIKIKADKIKQTIRLMELCGTHSQAVAANGIKNIQIGA
ncbi:hypothetical protein KKA09_00760 [Patescibacteria group bacterium]|nr:hypothetical protein [Patescibacteria group bacterium]